MGVSITMSLVELYPNVFVPITSLALLPDYSVYLLPPPLHCSFHTTEKSWLQYHRESVADLDDERSTGKLLGLKGVAQ